MYVVTHTYLFVCPRAVKSERTWYLSFCNYYYFYFISLKSRADLGGGETEKRPSIHEFTLQMAAMQSLADLKPGASLL